MTLDTYLDLICYLRWKIMSFELGPIVSIDYRLCQCVTQFVELLLRVSIRVLRQLLNHVEMVHIFLRYQLILCILGRIESDPNAREQYR